MRAATVLVLLIAACGQGRGDCPSDAELEALHAAAFYFDREQPYAGRSLLDSVRSSDHPTSREIIRKLTAVSEQIERDPEGARIETAGVRELLGDWRCLGPDLHRRLHRELAGPQPR